MANHLNHVHHAVSGIFHPLAKPSGILIFQYLIKNFKTVIVEGSGGVLVPYNDTNFLIDVAKELDIPVIVVSINKLGTINHTLLTIEALKTRGLKIRGIIFNNKTEPIKEDEIILKDNIEIIEKISGIKVLGEVKYNKDKYELIRNFENEKIGEKLYK